MPKATLSFTLPEEQEEFDLCRNGTRLSCAVDNFDNFLRGKIKYEDLDEKTEAIYQAIRDKLWECLNDYK